MKNASALADTLKSMTTSLAPMPCWQAFAAGLRPVVSTFARRIAFSLLLLGASLWLVQPCAGTPFQWEYTGSLGTERGSHTATLLPNGKVLVAGGHNYSFSFLSSAELYDPATGMWSSTGSLGTNRDLHTATLLSSGKVLVTGGNWVGPLNGAELYDPASGTWSNTGSLGSPRESHTATLLSSGKVLVAAGSGINGAYLLGTELYDPASGTWSSTGSLGTGRIFTTATLLSSGEVLLASGLGPRGLVSSAEVYDPASGSWSSTGSLATARHDATATLLPSGKVLVAGGYSTSPLTSAELYDPASGTWSSTGSLGTGRYIHTAMLLDSGKVLVAAGFGSGVALSSAELYDPGVAITLSAAGRKVGGINTVRLTWSGAISTNTDVYRNGIVIATVPNTGTYTDSTGDTGRARYTYKVCEAGTQTCSNEVTVRFRR